MSGKVHAFMIFLGVLLMIAAAALYVRYAFGGPDPNAARSGARLGVDVNQSSAAAPDRVAVSPTTSLAASATSTPKPTATPTPTPKPTVKPTATSHPTTPAPPRTTTPATWRLVWSDEFSSASLDSSRWTAADATNVDLACMTSRAENVSVAGGVLLLHGAKEDYPCPTTTTAYTGAWLDTAGKASFTYGAFEIRAKAPDNDGGVWPVFWLHSGAGDIEVVNAPGGAGVPSMTQAAIQGSTGTAQRNTYTFPSGYPADGFHTYRVEWEPGVLRWYVDGALTYTRDRSTTSWFDTAFAQAYDLRLALRVGGAGGVPTDATALPAELQVDYVRAYQR